VTVVAPKFVWILLYFLPIPAKPYYYNKISWGYLLFEPVSAPVLVAQKYD